MPERGGDCGRGSSRPRERSGGLYCGVGTASLRRSQRFRRGAISTPPRPRRGPRRSTTPARAGCSQAFRSPSRTSSIPWTSRPRTARRSTKDAGRTRMPRSVSRLRGAGALILGKTVTTELACGAANATRNPHALSRTPGGSSSGSAATVAAGGVPLALGTQTAGSVVRPAAFCGVWGMKPSFGTIPRTGVTRLSRTLDHVGVFAGSVQDVALGIDAISGDNRTGSGERRARAHPPRHRPRPAARAGPASPSSENRPGRRSSRTPRQPSKPPRWRAARRHSPSALPSTTRQRCISVSCGARSPTRLRPGTSAARLTFPTTIRTHIEGRPRDRRRRLSHPARRSRRDAACIRSTRCGPTTLL